MSVTENTELLKVVSSQTYESCEKEWAKLLRALSLGLSYVVPIQAVLRQGRWQSRANPVAYVRKAAVRVAVRMGLVDIGVEESREVLACDLQFTDWEGTPVEHDEKLGLALYEFEEKYGAHEDPLSAVDSLPDEVMEESGEEVDWERMAELAGLDAGERIVLDLRVIGFRREEAFAACRTEDDRRILQAAWKRFERHKATLKKALQSGKKHAARRIPGAVPEVELVFWETLENRLKISFRKLVPENGKRRI